jgi:hypothetical protein
VLLLLLLQDTWIGVGDGNGDGVGNGKGKAYTVLSQSVTCPHWSWSPTHALLRVLKTYTKKNNIENKL